MATPEPIRGQHHRVARMASRTGLGLDSGRSPGFGRVILRDRRDAFEEEAVSAATSGIILEIDTQFEMPDWPTALVPAWIVRDTWGAAPPSALNGTALVRPGVTLGAGIWSMTMSAEAYVGAGVFLRGSLSYDTLPTLSLQTAPGNTIMGIGTAAAIQYLSATVAGLRVTSGAVSLTLSARNASDVNAPTGVFVNKVQLTAVRLSE